MASAVHPFQTPQDEYANAQPPVAANYSYAAAYHHAPPPGFAFNHAPPHDAAPTMQSYVYGAPPVVQTFSFGAPGYAPPAGSVPYYPPVSSNVAVYPIVSNAASHAPDDAPGAIDKFGALDAADPLSPPPPISLHPHDRIETGRWAVGLCAVSYALHDHGRCMSTCLFPWLVPFVPLAQIYARLGKASYQTVLTQLAVLYLIGMLAVSSLSSSSSTSTSASAIATTTSTSTPTLTGVTRSLRTYSSSSRYRTSGRGTPIPLPVLLALVVVGQLGFRAMLWRARGVVRVRFALPGDSVHDALVACCCTCCAIAQLATHVKSFPQSASTSCCSSHSFAAPTVLPAYTG